MFYPQECEFRGWKCSEVARFEISSVATGEDIPAIHVTSELNESSGAFRNEVTIMCYLLTALLAISLRLPAAQTFEANDWKPAFTEPSDVQIAESTVAILTHSSRAFDLAGETQGAVRETVATMKAAELPVLYLHDQHNPSNPAWMYLYDDWDPTAYLASDVGHIDLDLKKVQHVVSLGGYFGQCQRTTLTDVIRLWHRDRLEHNMRLTQVVDGVFTVGQHINSEDSYSEKVRAFRRDTLQKRHSGAVLTIGQVVSRIEDADQVAEFLQRQLPAVPSDVNVVMDVFGRLVPLQIISDEAPVLTFAYRRSNDFLAFETPLVDWTQPTKLWRHRIVLSQPVAPVVIEGTLPPPTFQQLPAMQSVTPGYSVEQPVFIEGAVFPSEFIESVPFDNGAFPMTIVPSPVIIEP